VTWYGLGPHECYADRKSSGRMGLWEALVEELGVPYILPQENGNRTGTRALALSNASGKRLAVAGRVGCSDTDGKKVCFAGGASSANDGRAMPAPLGPGFDFSASRFGAGQM